MANLITNASPFLEALDYTNRTTAQKATIDALITAASEFIELECDRTFLSATHTDEAHDGNDWNFIFVKNPPLTSLTDIDLITYNAVTGAVETTTLLATKFTVEENTGEITFKPDVVLDTAKIFPEGNQNIHITYVGGYAAVPEAIKMLTADFVIQMYAPEELEGALQKEKLGDYFYDKGNNFLERLSFSKRKILSMYKIRKV